MKKRASVVMMLVAVLFAVPALSAEQPTVESVQKEIVAKWNEIKSLDARIDISGQFKMNPEQPNAIPILGGGDIRCMKKDGAKLPMFKSYAWAGLSEASKMAQGQAASADGGNIDYEALVPMAGVREAGSYDAAASIPAEAAGSYDSLGNMMFGALNENLNLVVAPDSKIGDEDVYVFAGTPKEADDRNPVASATASFSKKTGLPMQVQLLGKDGAPIATISLKDVKLNGDMAGDSFKFDTIMPAPPAAAPAPAPAQTEPAPSK